MRMRAIYFVSKLLFTDTLVSHIPFVFCYDIYSIFSFSIHATKILVTRACDLLLIHLRRRHEVVCAETARNRLRTVSQHCSIVGTTVTMSREILRAFRR